MSSRTHSVVYTCLATTFDSSLTTLKSTDNALWLWGRGLTSTVIVRISSFLQTYEWGKGNIVCFQCVGLLNGEVSRADPGANKQLNQLTIPNILASFMHWVFTLAWKVLEVKVVVRRSSSRMLHMVDTTSLSLHSPIMAYIASSPFCSSYSEIIFKSSPE